MLLNFRVKINIADCEQISISSYRFRKLFLFCSTDLFS